MSSSRFGTSTNLTSLTRARAVLDRAVTALHDAEAELAAALSTREVSRAIAENMQLIAEGERLDADAAARAYLAASKGGDASLNSMEAAFGQGRDLLAGLSGVARVTAIAGDAEKLIEIAAERDAEADAAEARAADAWAAVDAIDIEALEKKVDKAERSVASARRALSGLQTRVASASVSFMQTLPQDSGLLSDQGWSVPVSGSLTDGFGPRPNKPLPGVNEFHRGTDLSTGCREPVFAATAGTVVQVGPNGTYGNWVLIDHGSGISTGYAHLIDGGTVVSPGQTVSAGQLIAAVGSTGASTGCHLHFEVRIDGTAVDAVPFMAARGVALG